jgi:hypothetical protein
LPLVHPNAPTYRKDAISRPFGEADDGVRTRDLRLGKPTLYQLSYVRAARSVRPSGAASGADGDPRRIWLVIPSGTGRVEVGQVLADTEAPRWELGAIQRQSTTGRHGSRGEWRLQPAASVGAVRAILAFAPGLDHRRKREQAHEGEQVREDQQEIEGHGWPGRYWIAARDSPVLVIPEPKLEGGTLARECVGFWCQG